MAIIENNTVQAGIDSTTGTPSGTSSVPTPTHTHGVLLDTGVSAAPSAETAVGDSTHTHTSPTSGAPSAETAVGDSTHTHTSPTSGAPSAETAVGDSTHTHSAGAFTGTEPVAAAVAKFTGSGFATLAQVVTTTDNQTMTLNQCAGMWLITATQAPCLIVSNTAVAGAPAVLTVMGLAPTTAAEAYQILIAPTPAGSCAASGTPSATVNVGATAHTHAGGATGAPSATVNVGATAHTHAGGATGAPSATVNVGATAHTHGPGTLADAASGTPSATTTVASATHTHAEASE